MQFEKLGAWGQFGFASKSIAELYKPTACKYSKDDVESQTEAVCIDTQPNRCYFMPRSSSRAPPVSCLSHLVIAGWRIPIDGKWFDRQAAIKLKPASANAPVQCRGLAPNVSSPSPPNLPERQLLADVPMRGRHRRHSRQSSGDSCFFLFFTPLLALILWREGVVGH